MTGPTMTYPNCKTEIRLTELLAAPLIATTRQQRKEDEGQCELVSTTKRLVEDVG